VKWHNQKVLNYIELVSGQRKKGTAHPRREKNKARSEDFRYRVGREAFQWGHRFLGAKRGPKKELVRFGRKEDTLELGGQTKKGLKIGGWGVGVDQLPSFQHENRGK